MTILNDNVSLIFSFNNDKISKPERERLAKQFSEILRVNVLVCDKDCKITAIQHPEVMEFKNSIKIVYDEV